MFDALYIGATGMQAQQLHVDTIANNLANANTAGFKKSRVGFSDLLVQNAARLVGSGAGAQADLLAPVPRSGAGVSIAQLSKMFDPGDLNKTGSDFDLAVQGEGFLEVMLPDGSRAYSRGGTLKINKDGMLAVASGHPLKPGIQIPADMKRLQIGTDGRVQATVAQSGAIVDLGQIELVRFVSPQGLLPQGDNLYRASDASGEAVAAHPGEEGVGQLIQGALEASNVKMVDEMVQLVVAQRTYEANVKIVQASDEMMGLINGLRR